MTDGNFFDNEANKILECTNSLSRSADTAGFDWKDSKYKEFCRSIKEMNVSENSLRMAATTCKASYDDFWNIARRQV